MSRGGCTLRTVRAVKECGVRFAALQSSSGKGSLLPKPYLAVRVRRSEKRICDVVGCGRCITAQQRQWRVRYGGKEFAQELRAVVILRILEVAFIGGNEHGQYSLLKVRVVRQHTRQ